MKKEIITFVLLLAFVIGIFAIYSNRIEKINNGEMTQVSESYRDR